MSSSSGRDEHFIAYLEGLAQDKEKNLGALAALRRGLGKPPGEAAEMYPYVTRWVSPGASLWQENAYYLVAALFAYHQGVWHASEDERGPRNLGASLAWLARQVDSGSIEKRFVAMLNCHSDDLPQHVRHAVALLKSRDVPIDWVQLLHDIQGWSRPNRIVQRRWAQAFWRGNLTSEAGPDESPSEQTEATDV